MIIVTKDRKTAYNLEKTDRIYVTSDQATVRIVTELTRGGCLGQYGSVREAEKALEIAMRDIELGRKNVVYMPDNARVAAEINEVQHYHHIAGKKTKGHGGS